MVIGSRGGQLWWWRLGGEAVLGLTGLDMTSGGRRWEQEGWREQGEGWEGGG